MKCHWTGMNFEYSTKTAGSLLLTRRMRRSNNTTNIEAQQNARDEEMIMEITSEKTRFRGMKAHED